jgi:CHAD domain-containing protein
MAFRGDSGVNSEPVEPILRHFVRDRLNERLTAVRKVFRKATFKWDQDIEHVHKLRVSCRHAIAALDYFEELLPPNEMSWLRKKLKATLKATRRSRDLDVMLTATPATSACAGKTLKKVLGKRRRKYQKALVKLNEHLIDGGRFRRHHRRLLQELAASPDARLREPADAWMLNGFNQQTARLMQALPQEVSPESIHRFRIRAKQVRYAADLAEPLVEDPRIRRLAEVLPLIQKELGHLQDHVAAFAELSESGSQLKPKDRPDLHRCLDDQMARIEAALVTCREWLNSDECRELKLTVMSFAETLTQDAASPPGAQVSRKG